MAHKCIIFDSKIEVLIEFVGQGHDKIEAQ